jgi:energy-coupling factor transporter ATP-binding protein EcfA2
MSIISTCKKNSNEYNELHSLYNSGTLDKKNFIDLIDYKNIDNIKFLEEIKKVLNLKNNVKITETKFKYNNIELENLEKITDKYVFTADNYIKMILIILRIRANIPIIMMGETGCGKTSLIKIIAELMKQSEINNENKNESPMKIYNIHAGINDHDIIDWIKKNNLLAGNQYNENKNKDNLFKKIWVFFDEINTCNSMGLISELMCKHSLYGEKIKENVIFIAACNPYRKATKISKDVGLINYSVHKQRKLVYTVNPLPHSLINFVFDFGNLTEEDEKRYIKSMISILFKNIPSKDKFIKLTVDAIFKAQNYIKKNNDISSVSLREVRRFVILYEWFYDFITTKSEEFMNEEKESIYKYSINLSIYLCYFIRISDKKQRNEFISIMNEIFGNFLEIPNYFTDKIIECIEIEQGIAKNRALLENIFTLFVCINNKIPVFICGKPGCSKSLSIQLIYKSMQGKSSKNKLFKKFPGIYMNSYQGSKTSDSKGVLNIFNKARKILKNIENIISMIYFDEMGLAEISKNNPLKVIHSQLEYDDNEDKVAFVGVSNWTLDASKMNRGIFLAIPEPDKQDLIDTAKTIAISYSKKLENFEIFKPLYQGLISIKFSPRNFLFKLSLISKGLKQGILVLHPVPIPSHPLTKIIGKIGTYQTGSIFIPSSTLYNNKLSSSSLNIFLVKLFKKVYI